jgi:5-methylcytosine-specific restriction endonuclease McrA
MMKSVDVSRLLNSTPLGPVLNERQLYRHRIVSGDAFGNGRRVNLLRYVAWLVRVRRDQCNGRRHLTPRPKGRISPSEILRIVERQDYRCALTGRLLTPITASLDRIVPVSRGGQHDVANAQVLHKEINKAKGTLAIEEFIQLCREVVAHADSTTSDVRETRQSL